MMKKFLLIVCGSFVGVTLALMFFFIASILFSVALMGISSSMGKTSTKIEQHSILHLDLSGDLIERQGTEETSFLDMMQGNMSQTITLPVMIKAIEKAANEKKIDGIYIEANGMLASPASREALRDALVKFRKSGKWIYAYGYEGFDQGDYYVSSVADSIFINPSGVVDVHGLASAIPYYKRLLEKVGVEMQVIRVGRFKSAVEPFMLDSISPENRAQQEHYLGQIWGVFRDSIAKGRNLTPETVDLLADSLSVTLKADQLVKKKLVDGVCYRTEMDERLCRLSDVKKPEDIRFVDPADLVTDFEDTASGDHVAVLYAVGEIDGSSGSFGASSGINTEELSKEIIKLKDDDNVKGLVLRVNSPGGSAFGSEQMWHALEEFKKSGKPFAVSMGDYAASGGYYISTGADRIFAMPTTITGSIGIFGMIPCYQELAENKLGVKTSVVKTNANSELGITSKRLTPFQREAIQSIINEGYDLFTRRCSEGRHVTQDSIKAIAEGRVWDGITAKKIGLVDELGNLQAAIDWVAKKANLKDVKTQNYPALDTDWRMMLREMMAQQYEAQLQGEMGMLYEWHKEILKIAGRSHILCMMEPVEIKF